MAQSSLNRSMPTVRRELLWNVSEPGDPYDIKRSMIAKMPGDKKIFMGDHLQLVCLLQAAEIERLCEFLDDYKLKLRQIQRNNLDRHSYEIQIKQLTQKLADQQSSKGQNSKLVEFIKRQQSQIQYLQGLSRDSNVSVDGLKQTYEKSLEMNNQLTYQNGQLRQHIDQIRGQLISLRAKYQAIERSKNVQIQQIRSSISQKDNYQTSLNAIKSQYQNQIRKYQLQTKRLKELNQAKNAQINDLMRQKQDLLRKLQASASNNNLQRQVYDYQTKFVMLGQQIQRLNIALRDYANKIEQSEARKRQLENALDRGQFQKRDVDGRLKSSINQNAHLTEMLKRYEQQIRQQGSSLNSQHQQQISSLKRQINDLTNKLRNQGDQSRKYREQVDRLKFQASNYALIQRQNSDLRAQVDELSTFRRRIVEYQNKMAVMMEQFQRLKSIIISKDAELEKVRSLASQNQSTKSQLRNMQSTLRSQHQYEINRLKSQYEHQIQLINRSKGSQLQGKSKVYQNQLDKLRQSLRLKNQEVEKNRQKIYELQTFINRNELEISTKIRNYESNIQNLRRQNEQLFNKTKLLGENDRKVYELQSKIQQQDRQLERLGQGSRVKEDQLITLRSRLRQTEGSAQNYQSQINRQIAVYQKNISSLRNQNQDLKRKLTDASQQMQRLGLNLRKLNDQKYQQEQSLRELNQRTTIDHEEMARRLVQFESKINSSSIQLKGTEQDNQNLKRQLNQSKVIISRYENQLNNLSGNLQQTLTNAGRDNEQLRKKVAEYETALTKMSQELSRLNEILAKKRQENDRLESNYRKLTQQFETTTRQFRQYQISIKNKFQGQISENINRLNAENQQLRRRLHDQENSSRKNIDQLQRRIQEQELLLRQKVDQANRLDKLLQDGHHEIENSRRQWRQNENSLKERYENELRNKQNQYQSNSARAQREIEDLRRKLQEVGGDSSRRLRQLQSRNVQINQQYEKSRNNLNLLGQQNDVLKRKIEGYETSIANYENQVRRRFQTADQSMGNMRQQNQQLRRKLQQFNQLSRKLSEYESRIALMSQQIQRVQDINREQNQQISDLKRQLRDKNNQGSQYQLEMNQRIRSLEQQLASLQRQNQEYKRRIGEYEQRLTSMAQQLQRANNAYRTKTDELKNIEQTVKINYQQLIVQIQRDNQDLNRKLKDTTGDVNRQRQQLENKLTSKNQQIERLQQNIRNKQQEINRLDQIARNQDRQIQNWRNKYSQLENNARRTLEIQVTQKYASYEQNIQQLNHKNSQFEKKLIGAMQQIQRLNNVLRLKVEESTQLNSKVNTLTAQLNQYQRRIRDTETYSSQNINALNNEKQQLLRRITQYENRLRIMNEQQIRLGQIIKTRTGELQASKRQFKQFQDEYALKIRNSSGQYEAQIDGIQRQTYELKRKLAEYESKIGLTSQQAEKLNNLLRTKTQELNHVQNNYVNLQRQHEDLRRKWQQINQVNRRVPQYEQRLSQLLKQNQKLQQLLNSKNQQLNSSHLRIRQQQNQLENFKRQINEYENQVRSKVSGYQQTNSQLKRQNQELRRRISQFQSKIALLGQQHQRVTTNLRAKTQQYRLLSQQYENYKRSQQSQFQTNYKTLHQNYTLVTNQYEVAKKHLMDYEGSIRKLHAQFERLQSILQELKKQRDSLIEKNRVLSQQIKRLNGVNNDLEEQAREVRLRLTDETALQKRISQHLSLMVVLFAEIETLRVRVREKQIEVVEVRKSSLAPHMV